MGKAASGPFVLRPGEGRPIDLGGFHMSVKATSAETDGAFSLLEADEPAGFGPPLHIHHDAAEAFYVLEGEPMPPGRVTWSRRPSLRSRPDTPWKYSDRCPKGTRKRTTRPLASRPGLPSRIK